MMFFNIIRLFADSEGVPSFVILFLFILFNITHLFAHS